MLINIVAILPTDAFSMEFEYGKYVCSMLMKFKGYGSIRGDIRIRVFEIYFVYEICNSYNLYLTSFSLKGIRCNQCQKPVSSACLNLVPGETSTLLCKGPM